MQNTKQTLDEKDKNIKKMIQILEKRYLNDLIPFKTKLYISCINECPIGGKIDNDYIVHRILNLNNLNVDNICLSDTCGTLSLYDFEYIIDNCMFFGIHHNKISLHLHVLPNQEEKVEKIMHTALDKGIVNFDVSMLNTLTTHRSKLAPNLSYELYYKFLIRYIYKKANGYVKKEHLFLNY
jgi:hypothetical protein